MKYKFFDINDEIFVTWIRIYYDAPPPMFWDIQKQTDARSLTDTQYNPCIWIRDTSKIWVIAHELVHCISDIHRKKWIPQNSDTEEVFAYMMDYYLTKIVEKFNKLNTRITQ